MRTLALISVGAACCLAMLGLGRGLCAAESDTEEADDPIVAKVNDHPIHQSNVAHLREQLRAAGRIGDRPVADALLIEELVRRESLRQLVLMNGVKIEQEAIEARYGEMKKAPGFEEYLTSSRVTEDEIKEMVFVQLGLEKLAESSLTKEELDSLGKEVRASHILVKTSEKVSEELAKQKILFIKTEIEGGRSFAESAGAYSECPSSAKGGDLGFFPRHGKMVEPFAKAAFMLKKSEISEPVKTRFGYHLITVTETRTVDADEAKRALAQARIPALVATVDEKVKVERFYKETEKRQPPQEAE